MVLCTAYDGSTEPKNDIRVKMCSLREWHPEFAFRINLFQVQMLHSIRDRVNSTEFYLAKAMRKSCVFYDFPVLGITECRKHIK
jgi:hypothetical protein